MIAGPPSGGRPPLTDAKPLVFTGIHSRVGIWSIVFSVVFLAVVFRPLSYSSLLQEKSDGGLTIGTIMLLIQIVPLVIGGLVGIVFILRHRQRLRVDANGFRIRVGRRFRTLGWDQVRGNLVVSVIPLRSLMNFNLKPLLLPVITVEGERIELPCLMGDPYYERRAHQRVERAMAARADWALLAPAGSATGWLALVAGVPGPAGRVLALLGALVLCAVHVRLHRRSASVAVDLGAMGAVALTAGDLLTRSTAPCPGASRSPVCSTRRPWPSARAVSACSSGAETRTWPTSMRTRPTGRPPLRA